MWEPREEPGLWRMVVKEVFLEEGGAGTGARQGEDASRDIGKHGI